MWPRDTVADLIICCNHNVTALEVRQFAWPISFCFEHVYITEGVASMLFDLNLPLTFLHDLGQLRLVIVLKMLTIAGGTTTSVVVLCCGVPAGGGFLTIVYKVSNVKNSWTRVLTVKV